MARVGGYNVQFVEGQRALAVVVGVMLVVFSFAIGSILFDAILPATGTGFANVCSATDLFHYGYRILGVSATTCGTRDTGLIQIMAMIIPLGMLTKVVKVSKVG